MTQTYTISGMTCNNCVARVKKQLLDVPGITSAEVTLHPQQALISSSSPVEFATLQQAVSHSGHYTISPPAAVSNNSAEGSIELTWFKTYKPLLLIFAFISGVSLFAAYHEQSIDGMQFMTTFMAGFFLVFSFFKLLDLRSFANSYAMYDILASKFPAYGFIYPFIELGLGILFLTGAYPLIANSATLVVMGFSSIGVMQSVFNKKKIRCACLGAVFNFPMSTVTIIEDLLMVAMAAGMLLVY